jgi:glycosyltransferase involved in cell wall biosynthesis
VSVLLPVYNGSRWLATAVSSVLAQTHANLELIILDDASTDGSLPLARSLAKKDRRIKVVAKKHSGLSDTLNRGLRLAKGSWIARIDQDDLWLPEKLSEQIDQLLREPDLVLLGTSCVEIDAEGREVRRHRYASQHDALMADMLEMRRTIPHSSVVFSREKALALGGYKLSLLSVQDKDLWLNLAAVGRLACMKRPLIMLRKHPGQTSRAESGDQQGFEDVLVTVVYLLRERHGCAQDLLRPGSEREAFTKWLAAQSRVSAYLRALRYTYGLRAAFYGLDGSFAEKWGARLSWLARPAEASVLLWRRHFSPDLAEILAQNWMASGFQAAASMDIKRRKG